MAPSEEKAATEKAEKEQAEIEKIRQDWNAYTDELEKIQLPTGKKATVQAKDKNGKPFDIEGTQYGNFLIRKEVSPGSSRYGGGISTYHITHVPTGGLVGKVASLNDAKIFLKAIIHSKARVDFKNIKDLSEEELALWKDIANSVDKLQAPKYFTPVSQPPAEKGEEVEGISGELEDMISQIEWLGALKAQGLLTEEEFAAAKQRLLAS